MAKLQKRQTKRARVEIIPLIDVIFFLLATFVLFMLSMNRILNIPLDLPKAVPAIQTKDQPEIVTIQVSDQGTIYWNQEIISAAEVPSRLRAYMEREPDPRVLVAGDDRARYGPTIDILDQVRLAGIKKVSIETRVRPTGR